MSGAMTGYLGFAIAAGTFAIWFRRVFAVNIPKNRSGFVVVMALAALLGIAAFAQGPGWIGGIAAALAILLGGFFLLTVAIGDQKGSTGQFQVGQKVPEIRAPADDGRLFEVASLTGNPLLLKFFRGHW